MPDAKDTLDAVTEWSDLLPTALKLSWKAIEKRHRIYEWWQQLKVKTDFAKTNIVVTGLENSGKSVLQKTWLMGAIAKVGWERPQESDDVETEVLTTARWARVVRVIPGQSSRERDEGLDRAFQSNPSLEGVIHVVDWGYNSPRRDTREFALWQEAQTPPTPARPIRNVKDLRENRLYEELDELKLVCRRIESSCLRWQRPKWLLIAVTKVDLFLNEINEAQLYYDMNKPGRVSVFSEVVSKLRQNVGLMNLSCAVVPIAPISCDFEWPTQRLRSNLADVGIEVQNVETVKSQLANVEKQLALWMNFLRVVEKLAAAGDRK